MPPMVLAPALRFAAVILPLTLRGALIVTGPLIVPPVLESVEDLTKPVVAKLALLSATGIVGPDAETNVAAPWTLNAPMTTVDGAERLTACPAARIRLFWVPSALI